MPGGKTIPAARPRPGHHLAARWGRAAGPRRRPLPPVAAADPRTPRTPRTPRRREEVERRGGEGGGCEAGGGGEEEEVKVVVGFGECGGHNPTPQHRDRLLQ